nr:hypothetical protein CFP56_31312 [Quercus suber]
METLNEGNIGCVYFINHVILIRIWLRLPIILFLMVIIMLELIQGFSCHNIDQASREEKEPSSRTKYSSMFLRSYSAILSSVESRKKNKISSFHTVSHRLVPGGPNPLHN